MNLKAHFSSLSTGASVDQQTGQLSVFDILEEIRAPQTPFHLPSVVVAISFEKPDSNVWEGEVIIHHVSPTTQKKIGAGPLKIPKEQKRVKAVFRFGGFPIDSFGRHQIVVSWIDPDGKKVGEKIFSFDAVQATQVASAPAHRTPSENEGGSDLPH